MGSSFGIAVFLLVYFVAAGFFTVYFTVNFVNANGTPLTTSQVNGLNTWFWAADIVALIVVGMLSDLSGCESRSCWSARSGRSSR